MVGSSFLAVALSGLLNPVLVLFAFTGIIGSWYWEPPRIRYERWNLAFTILAVVVFVYQLLSILAGNEVILAGASFLIFLLLIKLFNRRESKDYLHIYLLSFLLLTAGTVLNAEISYGIFFLFFVVSSTWALTIFHLRRELENNFLLRHSKEDSSERVRVERVMNSSRIVGKKFFIGTSLVSLAVFASALSLFLLFPRIGFGLFFDKGRGAVTMTGFSDGVELGGHGLIKKDTTVVMRVEVEGEYSGRAAPYLHWRGVAFDNYSKGEWRRSREAPRTQSVHDPGTRTTSHHLLYDGPRLNSDQLEARQEDALKQIIYLDPVGYDVLFGASMPLTYEFETKLKSETRRGQNDELRHPHSAGIKYTVYSNPTPPTAASLRAAGDDLPEGYEVYLQVPDEIPACPPRSLDWDPTTVDKRCRVRDLARFITKDARTNFDKALALETWLKNQLGYTLEMESPGSKEPVEFFLFERKKGHCEYFSSAMAIMARSVGVPARNVNGFLGGEWNEYDNYIAVRAGDAHSWVEVYFEGLGWVTFDPTPSGEADMLGRGSSSIMDRMRRIADTVRFKWFKWVIEYDLYSQLKLFRNVSKALKRGARTYFKNPVKDLRSKTKRHQRTIAIAVLGLGAVLILLSLRRRRRTEDARITGQKTYSKRDPVTTHYLAVLRTLARRGYRRSDATTPREFATRLAGQKLAGADYLRELTELYYAVEYGRPEASQSAQARELRERFVEALKAQKRERRSKSVI